MITTPIKRAAEYGYDVAQIVGSMTVAFSADPFVRWLYPSAQQYLKCFPDFVRILSRPAFEQKTVYCTDDYSGAALWLPPHCDPDNDAIGEYLQQTISPQQQEQVFAVFEQTGNCHPKEPYWYLAIVGVDSGYQGQGYGSALIQPILKECDRTKQIAYLESSSPGSAALYQRLGFEVLETIQIDDSPPLLPMIRYPIES